MEALTARPAITTLVEKISRKEGITSYKIIDVKTNQKGEGYLGEIFMITVKDATSARQLDMVIKAAFTDEKVRGAVPIRMSFQNEIYFYSEVYPKFQKFEQECGVSKSKELVPKCLMVSLDDKEEMLALQNLKSLGFEVFDKKAVLDDAHVGLIFKTYGRFHAYSYAMRDQKPEEYAEIVDKLYNVYDEFMQQGFFADHLVEMGKLVEKALIPGEDDVIIKKFAKYSGRNIAGIFARISVELCDNPAILHGDCWSNNMLFRYEDDGSGKKPVDMRLIDMQIMKPGSPVCDLSYCLYSGASKKVFDNLNHHLKIYHDSFSSLMRELGSDPEKLFSFSALKEHWKKYSRWGMIMSLAIVRMKLTDKEDIIDLRDGLEMDELIKAAGNTKFSEEDFNKRIRGLLWHMHEVDAL